MDRVYCVFKEEIIQMCYDVDVLEVIFLTRQEAENYVKEAREVYSDYRTRTIEELKIGEER